VLRARGKGRQRWWSALYRSSSRTQWQPVTSARFSRIERDGFRIVALRLRHLSLAQAEGFYYVHRGRPFFGELCRFMSSGPCLTLVLEREGAIARLRDLMGATDPVRAAPGTIRRDFAKSIETNAIHGSDAAETARFEIGYFFSAIGLA
jgi:nucleoside-diphosphate kinase